jgi:hypothetical protein
VSGKGIKGINWQRGFFRIWLATSALWIAAVWWVSNPIAIINHPRWTLIHFANNEISFPSDMTRDEIQKILLDPNQVRTLPNQPSQTEIATETDRALRDYQPYSVKRELQVTALWALGPPTLLLMLGQTVAWIYRGFRHTR